MGGTNDYGIVVRLTSRWETHVMTCHNLSDDVSRPVLVQTPKYRCAVFNKKNLKYLIFGPILKMLSTILFSIIITHISRASTWIFFRHGHQYTPKNEFGVDKGYNIINPPDNAPCRTERNDATAYNNDYPKAVYYRGQTVVIAHPTKVL